MISRAQFSAQDRHFPTGIRFIRDLNFEVSSDPSALSIKYQAGIHRKPRQYDHATAMGIQHRTEGNQ
jgi:hypothetical protein